MKVKLLTILADATRRANPGDEIEVDKDEGKQLIDGGYAIAVGEPNPNKKKRQAAASGAATDGATAEEAAEDAGDAGADGAAADQAVAATGDAAEGAAS